MTYWQRYSSTRISRRRTLVATGAGALGAAFLAACGGKSDSGSGGAAKGDASGVLSNPVDTTDKAKAGGTYQTIGSDPSTLDPVASGERGTIISTASFTYPKLLKNKVVKYPARTVDVEGDLAESWELSPDKLKLTMKLRRGLKWDIPSGREIDAQDVVFSWNRIVAISPYAANFANKLNPQQSMVNATAVDANTVTIELSQPDPALLGQLSAPTNFIVMPRESDGGWDIRKEVHGYGPYSLESYEPSVGMTWKKNPNFYVKGKPYFDKFRVNFVSEYATRLAQFRAGNIWTSVVNIHDVFATKKALPDTVMQLGDDFGFDSGPCVIFSYESNSPWKDQRVRQAVSYMIDRQSFRDYATNEKAFASQGIELDVRAQGTIAPGWQDHWLNPLDAKTFGPNAKFYQPDTAEAKKLLSAAGFGSGIDSKFYSLSSWQDQASLIQEQFNAGGLGTKYEVMPSGTWFATIGNAYAAGVNSGFRQAGNGFALRAVTAYSDVGTTLATTDMPYGRSFIGMTPDGKNPEKGDPELTDLMVAMRHEFDNNKLKKITGDYQKAMAPKAYRIPLWWSTLADVGSSATNTGFTLSWPVIGNLGTYRTAPGSYAELNYGGISPHENGLYVWMDDSKAPIKKSS